jgi:inosine/xanthosine triphosphate pyrophosphatase family protein
MATMESEVKNSISHRAIAAKSFLDELEKINT